MDKNIQKLKKEIFDAVINNMEEKDVEAIIERSVIMTLKYVDTQVSTHTFFKQTIKPIQCQKTGEKYPCYSKPSYGRKDARDQFPNGNMLMASEMTGVYGPAIYICKVMRVI